MQGFVLILFSLITESVSLGNVWFTNNIDTLFYHLVDMNTSTLSVESQVILNPIPGFKSKNILKCAFKAKTWKAQCAWCIWRTCVSKALPQTGNTVPYYLFDYGNTEIINLNILLGCLVV